MMVRLEVAVTLPTPEAHVYFNSMMVRLEVTLSQFSKKRLTISIP